MFSNSLKLKHDAVPSVFQLPSHLEKSLAKRPPPTKRQFIKTKDTDETPAKKKNVDPPRSPTKDELKLLLKTKDKKLKILQQKIRRKEKKVVSLNECIKDMKDKQLVGPVAAAQLEETFSGLSSDIILNHFQNKDKSSRGNRHSDEAKKFALTLHFYSPRAYEHVRSVFLCLIQGRYVNGARLFHVILVSLMMYFCIYSK